MKRAALNIFIFFLPITLILGIYIVKDPFMVLYKYDNYYTRARGEAGVFLNRDHISTEMLLNNYTKNKYDSYIFGSSRSENFRAADWGKHVNSTHCFHFAAFAENLYGIERKMQLIKDRNMEMKNVLLVMDEPLLSGTADLQGHLVMKHHMLSGVSAFSYQLRNLGDYLSKEFLPIYLRHVLLGPNPDLVGKRGVLHNIFIRTDTYTNEIFYPALDSQQKYDPMSYYNSDRTARFQAIPHTPEQRYSAAVIKQKQVALLQNIKKIVTMKGANCKVVISPMYDEMKLNPDDLRILQQTFGAENVFDFSGINDITGDMRNYYDEGHFSQDIASSLMDSMYTHK